MKRKVEKDGVCVLIEGPRWADCQFYSRWLAAAAKAETYWTAALKERQFNQKVERLRCAFIPSFEIAASVTLMRLEKKLASVTIDPNAEEEIEEFCMMALLGFFQLTGWRYQMTVPRRLTMARVKNAAFALAKTQDEDYVLHPELIISTVPISVAKACQRQLRLMDDSMRMSDRDSLLELC